ncbi:hypothetical protein ACFWAO_35005, partial [Streptomyces sp. NPDC059981]
MNDSPGWATPGSPSDGQGSEADRPAAPPAGDGKWSAAQPPPGQWSSPGTTPPPPAPAPAPPAPPSPPPRRGKNDHTHQPRRHQPRRPQRN